MSTDFAGVHAGVSTTILRYGNRLDANDLEGLLDCFAAEAHLEFFDGSIVIDGVVSARSFFEKNIAGKLRSTPPARTMHLLPNILITSHDPENAQSTTTGVVYSFTEPGASIEMRGLSYRHVLRRVDDDHWLIVRQDHSTLWQFDAVSVGQRIGFSATADPK